jgi:SAM-dependent methyltransferase
MDLRELQKNWDGFGRTDPLYAISTIPGKEGGRWDPEEFFAAGRREIAHVMDVLATAGFPSRGRSALDFGCGVGRLSQALAGHFDEVTGVDIAPSMVEQARAFNGHGERVRYVVNSRDDLRAVAEDGSRDLVLSKAVLQHMHPRYARGYIAEFLRVAAPGTGYVVFQQHSHPRPVIERAKAWVRTRVPEGMVAAWRRLRDRSGHIMEVYGMSVRDVTATVRAAGGEVVHVEPDPEQSAFWETFLYVVKKKG